MFVAHQDSAQGDLRVDEGQTWFRVRHHGSKVPDYASRLEIMRKDGHELHVITQSPKLIDAHMRELCNGHVHFYRPRGAAYSKRYQFEKPELSVNENKYVFPSGEDTRVPMDSAYFGCYKSVKEGTKHHFKFRIPRAALVLGFVALVVGGIGYYLYGRLSGFEKAAEQPVAAAPVAVPAAAAAPSSAVAHVTTEQYIAERTPRLAGVPSSAPIYDELTKPVTFPKPSCYATKSEDVIARKRKTLKLGNRHGRLYGCACFSQQATRMDVEFNACMDMVENGAFDNTKPDRQQRADGVTDSLREADTPAAASAVSVPVAVVATAPTI
ncbi:zonular occludens toxin [Pseudomonas cavernae]|uniref:Zonular occludens toxin n=1 Tax=Pseudomonas cavernae TaxID=2320867 RepID=A0A385Z387_9PSED|nr:zonular occludens toxin domain-containing protein [Pseudomonas cavernae]AYC32970.1 zonular occludens toxin [Pseudomonas cavernae]